MNAVAKKHRSLPAAPAPPKKPKRGLLFFIALCSILAVLAAWKGADFLDLDEDGNLRLSSSRDDQMQQRLKRLNQCEQYVLQAKFNGFYPCYSCGVDTTIFLHAGEVWKYGITIQGEKGRYRNWLTSLGLRYRVQYRGSIQECLRQETLKIYQYALLPENTIRTPPLIRPPGNKADL
jgi:hypothetical protein